MQVKLEELETIPIEDEAAAQALLDNYDVYVGGAKEPIKVKRCLVHLLKELAQHGPKTNVRVDIYYAVGTEAGPVLKKCKMVGPDDEGNEAHVGDAIDALKDHLITPTQVIQRLTAMLAELGEFCDMNTVTITAMFDTHGIVGTTYANPATEIDEPRAGMMYESMKSHAEAYKDKVNATYGFKIGSNIIMPGSPGQLLGPTGRKI